MAEIELSLGYKAIVDEDDVIKLSQWKWKVHRSRLNPNNIYAQKVFRHNGKTKCLLMHRFILNVTDRSIEVDHKNGNGLDNRKVNLRLTNRIGNLANMRKRKGSKSKLKGVVFDKRRISTKPWLAQIKVQKKKFYGGYFATEEEAHAAYLRLAKLYYGEFANAGT